MTNFLLTLAAAFTLGTPAGALGASLDVPAALVVLALVLGALPVPLLTTFAVTRLRPLWRPWYDRHRQRLPGAGRSRTNAHGSGSLSADRPSDRARRLLDRYGAPGFGMLGPLLFGTWGTAILGSALSLPHRRLIPWLAAGAAFWGTAWLFLSEATLGVFAP
ncbi:hypothetical protein [Streptomyces sp. NPDC059861]|uniref:hypothetical protein n=1 Tax=Streptomyces sp. NPDC059861 TaxID=3346974 RepID=UPI0036531FC6